MARFDNSKFPRFEINGWFYDAAAPDCEMRYLLMKFLDEAEAVDAYEHLEINGDLNQIELERFDTGSNSVIIRAKDANGELDLTELNICFEEDE